MKTRQQIQKWILENCVDSNGNIVMNDLDFGDKSVYLSGMKAKTISQSVHKAKTISQYGHECNNVKEGKHISINEMTLEEAEKKFNIKIVK